MRIRCSVVPYARWTLFILAVAFVTATTLAQNVNGFVHAKIQNFQQTSTAAPVVHPTIPFQFGSVVTKGTATITGAMVTFSGTSSPRSYSPLASGSFSILDAFTTQAQLDAAYGLGTYNLSVVTDAGTFSRSLFFFPFTYPPVPMLTVPAADWQSGAVVIDSAAAYNFTWNTFTGGGALDGVELIFREASLTVGPLPATQTSYALPAGTLLPGRTYTCDLGFLRGAGTATGDMNIGTGYAAFVKDTGFMVRTLTPALALMSAVSRKTHGAAGDFDIALPLSGTPGIECRTGGGTGDYRLIITFNNMIVSGSAAVSNGAGSVAGTPTFSANAMTVNLTGVTNAQTVTVTLSSVTDEFSQTLPDTVLSVSFVLGDSNGNGTVNASDVSQTKSRIGQAIDTTNFRSDVNANGTFNASDVSQIKANIGVALDGMGEGLRDR
ncbi:MAG: dockerin type I domain-containing protein [Verrucomicrobiota bacterium]